MYELHYKVDRDFTNAPLPRGGRWVGSKLGLKKYDAQYDEPARIWYGTPTATKRAAGVAGAVPSSDDQEP